MNNFDKSNIIIDEANEIVENFIREKKKIIVKKSEETRRFPKMLMLSILTITIVLIILYIIKII